MKFDLSKLREKAMTEKQEEEERKSRQGGGNSIPLMYLYDVGKYRFKILANEKSQLIQRKLTRHNVGKAKIPCLEVYGEECPICKAIAESEATYGKDCGAWRKYRRTDKGLCYAVIMGHDNKVLKGKDDPKIGDLVLLMYPMTIYNAINDIIVESGNFIESIFMKNEGKTIEITKVDNTNFNCAVYAYGDEKVCETDEEFEKLMEGIPSLGDAMGVPSTLSEEDFQKARAAGEAILAEFAEGKVINPDSDITGSDEPEQDNGGSITGQTEEEKRESKRVETEKVEEKPKSEPVNEKPSSSDSLNEAESTRDDGKPACFGNHDNSAKCLICPWEPDCLIG